MPILYDLWSFAGYLVPFVFVLSLVVFIHELGHFLVGRWCGVKVDAFSLGLGPELAHFVDGQGTRWRLALLPLGGYVKFHGDADFASMSHVEQAAALSPEARRISFFTQPVWKRMAIVAAGPVANFVLAVVVFTGVFSVFGRSELTPRVALVQPDEAAAAAGFQPGDLILSVNGTPTASWTDMQEIVQVSPNVPLTFIVRRGEKDVALDVTPRLRLVEGPFGSNRVGLIGLRPRAQAEDWQVVHYGLADAARQGVSETGYIVSRTMGFIGGLFNGSSSMDNMSGPIGTGVIAGEVAKLGFAALLNLVAVLSISIGLLNLFPIPLLDGGHLLYYFIEALKGRPLSERAQEMGFRVGLAFVGGLMLFATFNDIRHIVAH